MPAYFLPVCFSAACCGIFPSALIFSIANFQLVCPSHFLAQTHNTASRRRSAACKCNYHSSSHSERGGEALSLSTNIKAAPLLRPQFNGQPCFPHRLRKHSKLSSSENCAIVQVWLTYKLHCKVIFKYICMSSFGGKCVNWRGQVALM